VSTDTSDRLEEGARWHGQAAPPELGEMQESDTRREDGSKDARTLDPALQQHLTGTQPDPEGQTDARLGETAPRDRRTRKRFLRKPNSIGTAPRDHRQQTTVTNFLTRRLPNAISRDMSGSQ